jgi:hypothetical protein
MAEEQVWLASRNLKADAREWFRQVQHDEYPTWRRFTELLRRRFKPTPRPDPLHQLSLGVDNSLCTLADVSAQLDRLRTRLEAKEKEDRERRAAVRVQAAARGLLARRQVQALRAAKALNEQAALRLQAAGRGFLARRMVRKIHMLIIAAPTRSLRDCSFCTPCRSRVWGMQSSRTAENGRLLHSGTCLDAGETHHKIGLVPPSPFIQHDVRSSTLSLGSRRTGGHSGRPNLYFSFQFIFNFSLQ